MEHVQLERLLVEQHECVAWWQLRRLGWSEEEVRARLPGAGLRTVGGMDGVWTSVRGELSVQQRWKAATLTAPGTALGFISAALCHAFGNRRSREHFIVVVRHGSCGPRRHGDVRVCRTSNCSIESKGGIAVVGAARTVVDCASFLDAVALRRAVLECLRLRCATFDALRDELETCRGRRGTRNLREILTSVEGLPIARARSNAEAQALLRRPDLRLNKEVGGYEADLVDLAKREITELDGPRWHVDPQEDAKRDAAWRAEGFIVRRRHTDDAFDARAEW